MPLFDAVDFDDIVRRIRAAAETVPPGEWIRCSPIGDPHYFLRLSGRSRPAKNTASEAGRRAALSGQP